jgi:hypothetical protein
MISRMNTISRSRRKGLGVPPGAWAVLAIIMVIQTVNALQGNTDGHALAGAGTVRLLLTNTSLSFGSVEAATVTIDSVAVHLVAARDDESGFRTLDRTEMKLNLMDLRSGAPATLTEADIPEGTLDRIRLYIRDASVELADGKTFTLEVPGGMERGVEVSPAPGVPVGKAATTELLLDFDGSRSFLPDPEGATDSSQITALRFQPVLRVVDALPAAASGAD